MTVPVHGLPPVLVSGLELAVVPPPLKGARSLRVAEVSGDRRGQLVSFEDISSLEQASSLVGKTLLARRRDIPRELELHDINALKGREVIDEKLGSLGSIEELMSGPAQDIWVVRGNYGEVLIPVVDEIVKSFGTSGPLMVHVPHGLVGE